jgi:hypothetical protein
MASCPRLKRFRDSRMMMLLRTAVPVPQPVPSHGEVSVDWRVLEWGLFGGSVLAALALIVAAVWVHLQHLPSPDSPEGLPAGAQWKLSDSWATNLITIVTALAAVAGTFADKLGAVFVRDAPVVFAVTTAALLCFAAVAPVAYTVCQAYESASGGRSTTPVLKGTRGGLYASSFLTLFAVMGSLSSLLRVLLDLRAASFSVQAGSWIGTGLVAVLMGIYAIRTLDWAQRYAASEVGTPALAGIVSVTCCAGREGESVRRLSLL